MFTLEEKRNVYAHSAFGVDAKNPGKTYIIHVGSAEQRHLPDAEPFELSQLEHEPEAFLAANEAAATIIKYLKQVRDDSKILKQSYRRPDPEKRAWTRNASQ